MRYREEGLPVDRTLATTDDMYMFTVVLGLMIGVILTWLGVKGGQIWLIFWSVGLIVASIAYFVWVGWFAG